MAKFSGVHNHTLFGQVKAKMHTAWSQKRAWHADEVTLSLRCWHSDDIVTPVISEASKGESGGKNKNLSVKLKILDKDGIVEIDSIKDQQIKDMKLDHKYTIAWQEKPFADKREFVIKAVATGDLESSLSSTLLVDLDPPIFSA